MSLALARPCAAYRRFFAAVTYISVTSALAFAGCVTNWKNASRSFSGKPAEIFSADRKSTRLNSSHRCISYAVFCLKKHRQLSQQRLSTMSQPRQSHTPAPARTAVGVAPAKQGSVEGILSVCRDDLFFFNDTATTEIYTLSLHDALPI